MLTPTYSQPGAQRGTTMLEVLVTLVILTFGLLGLAALQSKMQVGSVEAYQRAQAVLLLSDMSQRIVANRTQAANYISATAIGTGDSEPASCGALAAGPERDRCEWSNTLKGASEIKNGTKLGAMIDARGCITQVQASNTTAGVCAPGIYQVSVAWQGMHHTIAPAEACGKDQYGDDRNRRTISTRVSVALLNCS